MGKSCAEKFLKVADEIFENISKYTSEEDDKAILFHGYEKEYLAKVFGLEITQLVMDKINYKYSKFYYFLAKCSAYIHDYMASCSSVKFADPGLSSAVKDYLSFGRYIRKTKEFVEFIDLVQKIYSEKSEEVPLQSRIIPFIFICGNSGSGKTQIPFSLPSEFPFLYFVQNSRFPRQGSLSDSFSKISEYLQECNELDYEAYKNEC